MVLELYMSASCSTWGQTGDESKNLASVRSAARHCPSAFTEPSIWWSIRGGHAGMFSQLLTLSGRLAVRACIWNFFLLLMGTEQSTAHHVECMQATPMRPWSWHNYTNRTPPHHTYRYMHAPTFPCRLIVSRPTDGLIYVGFANPNYTAQADEAKTSSTQHIC